MKKTFLVLGIACAALVAGAQSNASQDQPKASGVARPRDAATGQASGKRMHKPMTMVNDEQQASQQNVTSPREASSGMATGKREAASGQASGKNSMTPAQSNPLYQQGGNSGTNPLYEGKNRVAAGDVNSDGAASRATKTRSNVQNNRVAAGDVNGDGVSDATVSSQPGAQAQMKGDLSRGHQPDHTKSSDAGAGKGQADQKNAVQAPRDHATGQASGKRQH